jgi:hypothetical protein
MLPKTSGTLCTNIPPFTDPSRLPYDKGAEEETPAPLLFYRGIINRWIKNVKSFLGKNFATPAHI